MKKKVIAVTGVCGFIFSNFIRQVVDKYPEYYFIGIDKIAKEYNIDNIFEHPNYKFYLADISDTNIINNIFVIEKPDIVINGCASSFVDFAISDIAPFINDNIVGLQTLINNSLKYKVEKFIHISTDEIMGQKLSKDDPPWTEEAPLLARNPYSCTKASGELIVMASHYTHGLQFNLTRACNVFGPRQKKENLIPHIIYSLIHNLPIHIHGDGKNFRQYCFVDDKVNAIMKIIKCGKVNEIYNIGDDNIFTNLEIVNYIAKIMNKNPIITFIENRKSHDFGYKISSEKLKSINWQPKYNFNDAMKITIDWYLANIDKYKY